MANLRAGGREALNLSTKLVLAQGVEAYESSQSCVSLTVSVLLSLDCEEREWFVACTYAGLQNMNLTKQQQKNNQRIQMHETDGNEVPIFFWLPGVLKPLCHPLCCLLIFERHLISRKGIRLVLHHSFPQIFPLAAADEKVGSREAAGVLNAALIIPHTHSCASLVVTISVHQSAYVPGISMWLPRTLNLYHNRLLHMK